MERILGITWGCPSPSDLTRGLIFPSSRAQKALQRKDAVTLSGHDFRGQMSVLQTSVPRLFAFYLKASLCSWLLVLGLLLTLPTSSPLAGRLRSLTTWFGFQYQYSLCLWKKICPLLGGFLGTSHECDQKDGFKRKSQNHTRKAFTHLLQTESRTWMR